MFEIILAFLTSVRVFFRSRSETARDPRLAAADRRSQADTAASTVESVRPTILDYPALCLVPVGRSLSGGQTGDAGGISALLEVAVTSTCWPTENYRRNSGTHPPPGRR